MPTPPKRSCHLYALMSLDEIYPGDSLKLKREEDLRRIRERQETEALRTAYKGGPK